MNELSTRVRQILAAQTVSDLHTHLYPFAFGTPVQNAAGQTDPSGLMLWGIDELVTYHYLVAELFRAVPPSLLSYEKFWQLQIADRADLVWKHLFVERTPISEACRGVLTTLQQLGLSPNEPTLQSYRRYFSEQNPDRYIDRVMQLANVSSITMTNSVFDDNERNRWLADPDVGTDPRFTAVLRIDLLLIDYPSAAAKLREWGYAVEPEIGSTPINDAKRFLRDWIKRTKAIYVAVSLPPQFRHPAVAGDALASAGQIMLEQVVLPVCKDLGLPFAMMIGATRSVNPQLRDAGDGVGNADVPAVESLCRSFPDNRFLVTLLARENQHALCVAARKFRNLMPFGCWWFLNNPSLIEEIQRMRFELLGTSFIPQHSDARVLEQLIYKWDHTRRVLAKVLTDKYNDLLNTDRIVTDGDIARDVQMLLEGNFKNFLAMR